MIILNTKTEFWGMFWARCTVASNHLELEFGIWATDLSWQGRSLRFNMIGRELVVGRIWYFQGNGRRWTCNWTFSRIWNRVVQVRFSMCIWPKFVDVCRNSDQAIRSPFLLHSSREIQPCYSGSIFWQLPTWTFPAISSWNCLLCIIFWTSFKALLLESQKTNL